MQQSQRAVSNPALEHAVAEANRLSLPVVVGFGLDPDYPEANLRHTWFMLEGLRETAARLERRGIAFVLRRGAPPQVALELASDAAIVVCDRGYLRHQRRWRTAVADGAPCPVVQVEADVVVPVDVASPKAEFAARTLRPKIHAHLGRFCVPASPARLRARPGRLPRGEAVADMEALLGTLSLDTSVPPVPALFPGGTAEARRRLARFVRGALGQYDARRGRADDEAVSRLSPYLHFGQISPVEVALAVRGARAAAANRAAFLEELIVRRELAVNFVERTEDYDRFEAVPAWARATLGAHQADPRRPRYTPAQLEAAATGDGAWNAAMEEMKATGYLHNALRMYWGKKILEWSRTPEEAFATTLRLNNKYFLDGRDPNAYANVAWIFGLHDRPFAERPVFGKVRFMSEGGLRRKMDVEAYRTAARARALVAGRSTGRP